MKTEKIVNGMKNVNNAEYILKEEQTLVRKV